ncbi:MAG: RNA chaperone ProQ [Alkalimonas sp.]|nr:RNA chaperone ProQ [Alkalimonas sp.]
MTTPNIEQNEQATTKKPSSVKEVIALLAEHYPNCFSVQGPAKPLKIGIFQDLAATVTEDSVFSKTQLRQALRVYTAGWRYLESIKLDAARVDLNGDEVEKIDQQQAEHAAATLAESKAKAAELRKERARAAQAERKAAAGGQATDKKPVNKRGASRSNEQAAKTKVNQTRSTKVKVTEPKQALTPLADDGFTVGSKVQVRLGQAPMFATIIEVARNEVTVQLNSGMVVKTSRDSLFQS